MRILDDRVKESPGTRDKGGRGIPDAALIPDRRGATMMSTKKRTPLQGKNDAEIFFEKLVGDLKIQPDLAKPVRLDRRNREILPGPGEPNRVPRRS